MFSGTDWDEIRKKRGIFLFEGKTWDGKTDREILEFASMAAVAPLSAADATSGLRTAEKIVEFCKDFQRRQACL
jgi:hypothetical protein